MAKSANASSKAHIRQAFQNTRVARLAMSRSDIAPPRVKSIVDTSDGTLLRSVVDNDLPVEIDQWSNHEAGEGVQLQLFIEGNWTNVGLRKIIEDDTKFPLTLLLPKSYLAADATLQLRYFIYADNEPSHLPEITLRVDRTSPWDNATPDALIIADVPVTDEYLDKNPNGLAIELPAYAGQKANDKVAVFYLSHLPDDPADLPAPVSLVNVPANRKLFIPPKVINDVGNGGCYALYILWDIAGNESRLATYKSVTAALGKLPTGLGDPVVPLAAGGPIDLEDASVGVEVQIPAFTNGEHTDVFVMGWGDQVFEHPVSGHTPYLVPVPKEVLKAAYGAAKGPIDTLVTYRVRRGGLAIPTPPDPAKSTRVDVDFSYIGPVRPDPDPTWPDPVNTNLAKCTVYAKDSSTPNELLLEHNGEAATLQFPLYTPAEDGQVVQFYWNGEHVVGKDYTVDTGDAPTIEVEIPWSDIEKAGNAAELPVHYAISDKDGRNAQHAPATEVKVEAVIVVAPKPEFLGLNEDNGRLVCKSLNDPDNPTAPPAFRLQVPDLSKFNLSAGAEITLTWQPYWGESGETPLPPENVKEEIVKIDAAHPVTGFVWRIEPYEKHILPIYEDVDGRRRGRGRVFYSFTYQSTKVSSAPFDTVVNIGGAGGTCEI